MDEFDYVEEPLAESSSAQEVILPISWRAADHLHEERGNDWYWALGIIAVSAALTSILFQNFLFALVILAAAFTLGMLARRPPETIDFSITEEGFQAGEDFYPYDMLKAFWIEGEDEYFVLYLDTLKVTAPHLIIPIEVEDADPDDIRAALLEFVEETPLSEPLSHRILETLGF